VHSQAAPNISSSGKAVECLVSRQGLGRTQILLEILMLIFDWRCALVLRRSLRGWSSGPLVSLRWDWRHQRPVSGGQNGYQSRCSSGLA
jgi:hypothetical protein